MPGSDGAFRPRYRAAARSGPTVDAKLGYSVKCFFEKLEREPSVIARARRPWGIRVHPPLSMRAL